MGVAFFLHTTTLDRPPAVQGGQYWATSQVAVALAAGGEYRWRLRHRNGNVVADSGEGYSSRSAAEDAVNGVKRNASGADESA